MKRRYRKYLLHTSWAGLLFFTLLEVVVCVYSMNNAWGEPGDPAVREFIVGTLFHLLELGTYVFPVFLFSFVHRRRTVDMNFAAPVSRKEMLVTSLGFAAGFEILLYIVVIFIAGMLGMSMDSPGMLGRLVLYGALSLAVAMAFHSLLFLLGNSILDGIIMYGLYGALASLVGLAVRVFQSSFLPYGDFWNLGGKVGLSAYLSPSSLGYGLVKEAVNPSGMSLVPAFLALAVFAALSWLGLKKEFIERKSERAEQVSNGFFAYPFALNAITLLAVCCLMMSAVSSAHSSSSGISYSLEILLFFLIFFMYTIGTFIYRRRVRFTLKGILFYALSVALSMVFSSLAWQTHAFGFGDRMPSLPRYPYALIKYDAWVLGTDIGTPSATGYASEQAVEVEFGLVLRRQELQNYPEIEAMMEELYAKAAEDFYSGAGSGRSSLAASGFDTLEQVEEGLNGEGWEVSFTGCLSRADLQRVDRLTPVTVTIYGEGWNNRVTVPLEEYPY